MKIYAVMIAMVKAVHALSRKVQRFEPDLELDRLDHIVAVMWKLCRTRK